jgi:hypothetical protein
MAEKNRFCAGCQMRFGTDRVPGEKSELFQKKCAFAVDGRIESAILPARLKRDSRGRKALGLVLACFGTANWNSILSPFIRRSLGEGGPTGRHDWVFFVSEICENRRFFDIYIQGSKYNFKS